MLYGVPNRPRLPPSPPDNAETQDIVRYLQSMVDAITVYTTSITGNAVGFLNTRGLSSTGIRSENFVQGLLPIGNLTSAVWTLARFEPNATYLILYSPSRSTGMVLTDLSRTPTTVTFTFNPSVPSGLTLDVCLLR